MKTEPVRRWSWPALAALALVVVVAAGCRAPSASVVLRSYKDPYFPEEYRVRLAGCTYRVVANNDLLVVGRTERPLAGTGAPWVTQYLALRIYWRPWPGRTFVESSMRNATLRYVVAGEAGINVYTGTAFAYIRDLDALKKGELDVALESATLRLESRSGDLADFLGEATLTGEFHARQQPVDTARVAREVERLAAR